MSEPAKSEIFHCPHCGAETPVSGAKATCKACGREFEPAQVQTVAGMPAPPAEPPPPANNEEKKETPRPPKAGAPTIDVTPEDIAAAAGLPAGTELGGYRLEDEIGRGGMGVVYRGIQKSLQRKVAVKVLPRRLAADPHFVQRFEREALTLATLNHSNIVQIIDRGLTGEICWLAMEFVEGVSLRHLLNDQKLSPEHALTIVPQICAALEYAHGKGVVHRDIKPENILLTADSHVKITDFGLARMIHGEQETGKRSLTHTNILMGTPDYMAPEQREKAKAVDHRADIYSLGVIFYEMLTGELPIGRFPVPSKKVQVDVRLDEVILKSLEKEPDLRYQRASHISSDVKGIVDGQAAASASAATATAVMEPPPPPPPPSGKSVKIGLSGIHVRNDDKTVDIGLGGIRVVNKDKLVELGRGGITIRNGPNRPEIPVERVRLKGGSTVETGPRGVRVYEPRVSPDDAPGAAMQPAEDDAPLAGPGRLSALAILAFILAIAPLAILLLILIFAVFGR